MHHVPWHPKGNETVLIFLLCMCISLWVFVVYFNAGCSLWPILQVFLEIQTSLTKHWKMLSEKCVFTTTSISVGTEMPLDSDVNAVSTVYIGLLLLILRERNVFFSRTHTVLLLCLPPGQLGDCGGAQGGSCQHAGAWQTGGLLAQEEEMAHEGMAQGEASPALLKAQTTTASKHFLL